MHLLGTTLGSNQADLTPGQWLFLAEALPRVEMKRNGQDPDNPDEPMDDASASRSAAPKKSTMGQKSPDQLSTLKKARKKGKNTKGQSELSKLARRKRKSP